MQPPVTQAPVLHEAEACAREQASPQAAQSVLVLSGVSQPSFGFVQSAKPALQAGLQAKASPLPVQGFVPFWGVQLTPQAPQLGLLVMEVSQPSFAVVSVLQLRKPALQVPSVQAPVLHEAVAWARAHWSPQPVQSLVVLNGVSQPSSGFLLQSPKPPVQLG
jgi:hypothetical protein